MDKIVRLNTFYKSLSADAPADEAEIRHFNIIRVEDTLLHRNVTVKYSRRSFFKVSIIRGRSNIHYADQFFEITDYALVFTNPLIPFHWEIIGQEQEGLVCIFTEDFFNQFGNIAGYPVFQRPDAAIVPLNAEHYVRFRQLFEKAYNELAGNYAYKYDLLRGLLLEIVHEAQKPQPALGTPTAASNASERITSLFMELLDRQFPIEMSNQTVKLKTPTDFSIQLNVHVNHLNKALKEVTGYTTSQLIQERVLKEARILLKSTQWTINEIAWSLGFDEANHFSAFFKSRSKVTPKHFRLNSID